ncbi:hypothetical protein [Chryseobacterium sp. MMS23-Vi53]
MDSYGITKHCFYVDVSFALNLQSGLSGALFIWTEREDKKAGTEDG